MSSRRCLAAALLVLTSGCATVTTRQSWPDLPRGEHKVGFRTTGQIGIWYPAASGGEPLRFRDYAGSLDDLETSLHAKHFSDQAIVDLFDTPMVARRDAVAIAGKFPVVMIVTKDGESAADHAVLAEFLASHGYVVAAAPPKANIDAIRPTFFLHDVDVNTWTFLSSPADAKQKAEKLLKFVAAAFVCTKAAALPPALLKPLDKLSIATYCISSTVQSECSTSILQTPHRSGSRSKTECAA